MEPEVILLTRYMASWGWFILAILFFLQGIEFLRSDELAWMGGMFGVMLICMLMSMTRKTDIEKLERIHGSV